MDMVVVERTAIYCAWKHSKGFFALDGCSMADMPASSHIYVPRIAISRYAREAPQVADDDGEDNM